MRVVIVEDEPLTAEDLADTLLKIPGDIEVVKLLNSVTQAVDYFTNHRSPDLIFCDIQLGDGQSFEIFRQVSLNTPVVFCTAYNDFAVQAFKNNGIDYILKPFTHAAVKAAVDKFKSLREIFRLNPAIMSGLIEPASHGKKPSSLLVNWKEKIIPVKIHDIALFYIEYKTVQLVTFDNKKYFINYTLDELEDICSGNFYRANRQYLINKESVREVVQYHARKLFVQLKIAGNYEVLISKNKISEFLGWLGS